MPTPAAAGMIAAVVHAFHRAGRCKIGDVGRMAIDGGGAGRADGQHDSYYSFKDLPWSRKQPAFLILFLIILGALIWRFRK